MRVELLEHLIREIRAHGCEVARIEKVNDSCFTRSARTVYQWRRVPITDQE